ARSQPHHARDRDLPARGGSHGQARPALRGGGLGRQLAGAGHPIAAPRAALRGAGGIHGGPGTQGEGRQAVRGGGRVGLGEAGPGRTGPGQGRERGGGSGDAMLAAAAQGGGLAMSGGTLIPVDRLEPRLADAKPVYGDGEGAGEASRCLYCHDAPCVTACPTGIDIPGFIRKIATGNVRGSARAILSANLLGYSCARVCPVEVLGVGACVYNDWHRYPPIQIGRLQRYAVEKTFDSGRAATLLSRAPANGRKVACVGGGPASLAAAGYLALEGVAVTVFERRAVAGGLNATGVAPYKMHVEGAMAEVEFIRSLGVTIKTGVEVGRDMAPEALLKDYDAVFLGVGLGSDGRPGVRGGEGAGVAGAPQWIGRLKLEPGSALAGVERALVVGGGNTAIDAARELTRLGVADVAMVYRRTAADMSGYVHEMD